MKVGERVTIKLRNNYGILIQKLPFADTYGGKDKPFDTYMVKLDNDKVEYIESQGCFSAEDIIDLLPTYVEYINSIKEK